MSVSDLILRTIVGLRVRLVDGRVIGVMVCTGVIVRVGVFERLGVVVRVGAIAGDGLGAWMRFLGVPAGDGFGA